MSKIEVIEVGPRDGFQSVKCAPPIATELKLKVIDKMAAAGVKHMEYTSFVSPKAIPAACRCKGSYRGCAEKISGSGSVCPCTEFARCTECL